MDTTTPSGDLSVARLTAEVNAQQLLLDGLDQAIGTLYENRKHGVNRLWELQEQLARLKHYSALAAEAQAARS